MPRITTDVLIIGTGPAGSASGALLSTYGIDNMMVNRYPWLANTPRAHITNQRTMEVLRDLGKDVESEAYLQIQSILGEADAESTRIYAEAYGGTPERESFYEFVKTLEAYDKILDKNTTVILSTDSELFKLLKGSKPE